jgi:hypothetical protein
VEKPVAARRKMRKVEREERKVWKNVERWAAALVVTRETSTTINYGTTREKERRKIGKSFGLPNHVSERC